MNVQISPPPNPSRDLRKTKELPVADDGYRSYPPSILIVSDRPHQARKLTKELENNGCQVQWTGTGAAALAAVCQRYFDVIVLDLDQTGQNRQEVLQTVKACPSLADIPVVMLTTPKNSEDAAKIFSPRLIYDLPRDNSIATTLLQIVSQIHYLTYRYLPILT